MQLGVRIEGEERVAKAERKVWVVDRRAVVLDEEEDMVGVGNSVSKEDNV